MEENLLQSSGTLQMFRRRKLSAEEELEFKQRKTIFNLYVTICDVLILGMVSEYAYKAAEGIKNTSFYKHLAKHIFNNLRKAVENTDAEVGHAARNDLGFAIINQFPSMRQSYYSEGTPLQHLLQHEFRKVTSEYFTKLYYSCRNLCLKHSPSHADFIPEILVIHCLIEVAKKITAEVRTDSTRILSSDFETKVENREVDLLCLSRIKTLCESIIELFCKAMPLRDEYINNAIIAIFKSLSGDTMRGIQDVAYNACVVDYGKHCLSMLLKKIKSGTILSAKEVNDIALLFSNNELSKAFLIELRDMNIDVDMDVADLKDELDLQSHPMSRMFVNLIAKEELV